LVDEEGYGIDEDEIQLARQMSNGNLQQKISQPVERPVRARARRRLCLALMWSSNGGGKAQLFWLHCLMKSATGPWSGWSGTRISAGDPSGLMLLA
jgi:hypothetical protein